MATGDMEDWQLCQASLEEHVPSAAEDFTLIMSDRFSHCCSVQILRLTLLVDGTRETGNI